MKARAYVDVNAVYYYLTDNPKFADRALELFEEYYGDMITSALTPWLLYILLKRNNQKVRNLVEVLSEIGIKIVPLTDEILKKAGKFSKLDFEDAIHYFTMKKYGINVIISNDRDFEKVDVKRIF